ncbi:MAG: hypothetical protein ACI93R_001982 [Flavobacteriales bacterium]|jgi:hypothetical protein
MYAESSIDIKLQSQQIQDIVKAIECRAFARFQLDDQPCVAQSVIIGGDLLQGNLLLSEPFPYLSHHELAQLAQAPFWLQVPCNDTFLALKVKHTKTIDQMLMVDVLEAHYSNNRRWSPRAHFKAHKGPKVRLALELDPAVTAYLKNLSLHGGAMDFWNKDYQHHFKKGSNHTAEIHFNDQFAIQPKIRVVESRLSREPCCHTHIRFQIKNSDELERCQISTFLHSFIGTAI